MHFYGKRKVRVEAMPLLVAENYILQHFCYLHLSLFSFSDVGDHPLPVDLNLN